MSVNVTYSKEEGMRLSKKQKAIIWVMVLIITVALGMEQTADTVVTDRIIPQGAFDKYLGLPVNYYTDQYPIYLIYGIRLYRSPTTEKVWVFDLFANQKRLLIIATLLIGLTCLLTLGKSGPQKGKKD